MRKVTSSEAEICDRRIQSDNESGSDESTEYLTTSDRSEDHLEDSTSDSDFHDALYPPGYETRIGGEIQNNDEENKCEEDSQEDPILFSYRIGGELFIHDSDRQSFLESETIYDRLRSQNIEIHKKSDDSRMIIDYLSKKLANRKRKVETIQAEIVSTVGILTCHQCGSILGREDSIFQVPGAAGSIGAYVNPHGSESSQITHVS
jgi:hypothetical protein